MEATDLFPCFVHCCLRYVAVDRPGFGQSPGERPPGLSKCNNLPGGPADIAAEVRRRAAAAAAGGPRRSSGKTEKAGWC